MCTGRKTDARSSGVCTAVRSQTDIRIVFFNWQQNRNLVCCSVQRLQSASQKTAGGFPVAVGYDRKIASFACSKK